MSSWKRDMAGWDTAWDAKVRDRQDRARSHRRAMDTSPTAPGPGLAMPLDGNHHHHAPVAGQTNHSPDAAGAAELFAMPFRRSRNHVIDLDVNFSPEPEPASPVDPDGAASAAPQRTAFGAAPSPSTAQRHAAPGAGAESPSWRGGISGSKWVTVHGADPLKTHRVVAAVASECGPVDAYQWGRRVPADGLHLRFRSAEDAARCCELSPLTVHAVNAVFTVQPCTEQTLDNDTVLPQRPMPRKFRYDVKVLGSDPNDTSLWWHLTQTVSGRFIGRCAVVALLMLSALVLFVSRPATPPTLNFSVDDGLVDDE
jgi:hypothetical protein